MRYCTLDGKQCESTDDERGVWYSVSCGYWTDQWNLLVSNPIPSCPKCGCPGYQVIWKDWFGGAKKYEETNPGYSEFLLEVKEKCFRRGWNYSEAYQKWVEERR